MRTASASPPRSWHSSYRSCCPHGWRATSTRPRWLGTETLCSHDIHAPVARFHYGSPMVDAEPRRVIHNPISGERIEIRTSGAETDGRLLCFDVFLPPGGHVPAPHTHPEQVERFMVLAGQLRFRIGSKTFLASQGATIAVP